MRLESFAPIHPSFYLSILSASHLAVRIQISPMEKGIEVTLVSSKAERKVVEAKSILLKDKRVIKPFSLKTSVRVSRETTTTFDVHLAPLLTIAAQASAYVSLRDWTPSSPRGEGHWVRWVRSWRGFEKPRSACAVNGHLVPWEAGLAWTDAYSTHCVSFQFLKHSKDPCIFFFIILCL